ncbi:hypothetical protein BDK51DRAFT_42201 [Blyttiomyces helicus]|uniref:Uncharacterized protein n=1 Tax=Blyttiomyces helicus TaxID=388810 RepID=A0A4P9WEW8_9FUNG|nr:hypothetical protein BDK51DRAFT_42201 [Blyttiomyces helicus]|eukprot:RKO88956.1 hypothetical protein BDK51DRAFT_42201 [Blyttiomyces helicus]
MFARTLCAAIALAAAATLISAQATLPDDTSNRHDFICQEFTDKIKVFIAENGCGGDAARNPKTGRVLPPLWLEPPEMHITSPLLAVWTFISTVLSVSPVPECGPEHGLGTFSRNSRPSSLLAQIPSSLRRPAKDNVSIVFDADDMAFNHDNVDGVLCQPTEMYIEMKSSRVVRGFVRDSALPGYVVLINGDWLIERKLTHDQHALWDRRHPPHKLGEVHQHATDLSLEATYSHVPGTHDIKS